MSLSSASAILRLPVRHQVETGLMHHKLLLLALVGSLAFHGVLLLSGTYRGTYDAYVHIFFADHYSRDWWSLWEPRWYTGFTMASYPPLTHQLTALLSRFTSLTTGFVIVMTVSTLMVTLGVYRFSQLWVSRRAAGYAALLVVFSSSIAETVHVFGQLPTMFVMGVLTNALPFVWDWLKSGRWSDLARGWALLMVAAAGHHVTTLFGMVFFSGPIIAAVLLYKFRTPRAFEDVEHPRPLNHKTLIPLVRVRLQRVFPALIRTGIFGAGLIVLLVVTVLPYWIWSRSDPITQISIPHASRDSFIVNQAAGFMFFIVPWGVLITALPYALYKGFGSRNWPLAASLALSAFLGTGGTTPLPALLLRGAFYILTLDRFTFWATILILPFAGQFVESLLHGRLGRWIVGHFGKVTHGIFAAALGLALVFMALFTANLTQFRRFQPAPVDMTPIVEFLAKDNHDRWRYMTLGFGDQMAWLSAQTTALNVEGNYHSARRLPEMTSTPVERMDGAKFTGIPGLGSLQQFVTNPERYNLKYIFVNDAFYEPLLYFAGWHRLERLANDVMVWERADVPPLPAAIPAQVYPGWQRLMWGSLPVGSIVVTIIVFAVTGLLVPRIRFSATQVPLLGRIVRAGWFRRWLTDERGQTERAASEDWQVWKRVLRRIFPGLNLRPLSHRATYGLLLGIVVVGAVVAAGVLLRRSQLTPEGTLLAYYDALDFKRFSDSYDFLDTDLTREEYLRYLSLRGGIVASFAKLDNLYMQVEAKSDGSAEATVTAEWVTALGTYPQQAEYRLVQPDGGWRIRFDAQVPPLPRETFVAARSLDWYIDLPLSSLDVSALTRGVLDRSLLSASPARLTYLPDVPIGFLPDGPDAAKAELGRFTGLLSVVGYVTNVDAYPAQVTVSAILRDADGNRLAETAAMDVMLHQLLPGETTPYRIDFFGADATALQDIDTIASVEVSVRGVPTAYNLDRPLVLIDDHTLLNVSAGGVDIPRVLLTHPDAQGELLWVEAVTVEQSIGPDETAQFDVPALPEQLANMSVPVTITGPRLVDWAMPAQQLYATVYGFSR